MSQQPWSSLRRRAAVRPGVSWFAETEITSVRAGLPASGGSLVAQQSMHASHSFD